MPSCIYRPEEWWSVKRAQPGPTGSTGQLWHLKCPHSFPGSPLYQQPPLQVSHRKQREVSVIFLKFIWITALNHPYWLLHAWLRNTVVYSVSHNLQFLSLSKFLPHCSSFFHKYSASISKYVWKKAHFLGPLYALVPAFALLRRGSSI